MDTSEVLTEVMQAGTRNGEVAKELERIEGLLIKEDFEGAREAIRKLAKKTGNIPSIIGLNSELLMYGQEPAEREE